MADKKIVQTVEIMCKTTCKNVCNSFAKTCAFFSNHKTFVQKQSFSSNFSKSFHQQIHNPSPLGLNYFFHYSTDPTITITNK